MRQHLNAICFAIVALHCASIACGQIIDSSVAIPSVWINDSETRFTLTSADDDDFKRVRVFVQKAVDQIPQDIRTLTLEHVQIVRAIGFRGVHAEGTRYDATLFIATHTATGSLIAGEEIMAAVVHEWSSTVFELFATSRFREAWTNTNPDGFSYLVSTRSRISVDPKRQSGSLSDDAGIVSGFITPYASATLENDFNELSAWLFVRTEDLSLICKKSKRLSQKVSMLLRLYNSISEDFKKSERFATIRSVVNESTDDFGILTIDSLCRIKGVAAAGQSCDDLMISNLVQCHRCFGEHVEIYGACVRRARWIRRNVICGPASAEPSGSSTSVPPNAPSTQDQLLSPKR